MVEELFSGAALLSSWYLHHICYIHIFALLSFGLVKVDLHCRKEKRGDFSVVLCMHKILIQNQQTNVSLCFFCAWHQDKYPVVRKTKSSLLLEREHTRNV